MPADLDLDALRALWDKGNNGFVSPWTAQEIHSALERSDPSEEALIVAAVNALPALIERVERAEAERDVLKADAKRNAESWSNEFTLCLGERDRLKAKLAEAECAEMLASRNGQELLRAVEENKALAMSAEAERDALLATSDKLAHLVGAVHDQSMGPSYPGEPAEVYARVEAIIAERDAMKAKLEQEDGKASPWYAACQDVKAERDALKVKLEEAEQDKAGAQRYADHLYERHLAAVGRLDVSLADVTLERDALRARVERLEVALREVLNISLNDAGPAAFETMAEARAALAKEGE